MSTSYLSRSVTASTNTSYTVSMWIKFTRTSVPSGSPYMWSCGANGSGAQGLYMNSSDMKLSYYGHSGYSSYTLSDGSLRDYSGWYHIVWSVNAGTGTCYINGVQQGSTFSGIAPLNAHGGTAMALNTYVGTGYTTYDDLAPLMSHVHFIDGTAYPATTFGETDSVTGEWKIKTDVSVNYGTNGFFLFKDNASVNDQSGNGNNFTATGSVTQTEDNPSNVFPVLNQLNAQASGYTFDGLGSLSVTGNTGDAWRTMYATFGASSGKYYWEQKITNFTGTDPHYIGIVSDDQMTNTNYDSSLASRGYFYTATGDKRNNNTQTSYGNSWTTNDIVGIALDLDNSKIFFSKNGVWQNSGDPANGTNPAFTITSGYTYIPATSTYYNLNRYDMNFGNGAFGSTQLTGTTYQGSGNIGIFKYQPPTGFTALSTKGLNE